MGSGRQERYGRGRGALLSGLREAGKVREGEGGTAEWAQGGRKGTGGGGGHC